MQKSACPMCGLKYICAMPMVKDQTQGCHSGVARVDPKVAMALRESGMIWEDVAFELGVNVSSAHKAVKKYKDAQKRKKGGDTHVLTANCG